MPLHRPSGTGNRPRAVGLGPTIASAMERDVRVLVTVNVLNLPEFLTCAPGMSQALEPEDLPGRVRTNLVAGPKLRVVATVPERPGPTMMQPMGA
jgi:hypothetical protein